MILLDEPASALDPISTASIEDLMHELKRDYTIVIVTHNMQQAARVADRTAFFSISDGEDGVRTASSSSTTRPKKIFTLAGRQAHRGLRHWPLRLAVTTSTPDVHPLHLAGTRKAARIGGAGTPSAPRDSATGPEVPSRS